MHAELREEDNVIKTVVAVAVVVAAAAVAVAVCHCCSSLGCLHYIH